VSFSSLSFLAKTDKAVVKVGNHSFEAAKLVVYLDKWSRVYVLKVEGLGLRAGVDTFNSSWRKMPSSN